MNDVRIVIEVDSRLQAKVDQLAAKYDAMGDSLVDGWASEEYVLLGDKLSAAMLDALGLNTGDSRGFMERWFELVELPRDVLVKMGWPMRPSASYWLHAQGSYIVGLAESYLPGP